MTDLLAKVETISTLPYAVAWMEWGVIAGPVERPTEHNLTVCGTTIRTSTGINGALLDIAPWVPPIREKP